MYVCLSLHVSAVTGLAVSPDGTRLLSNAMDSSLRIWDIRAFVPYHNSHHGTTAGPSSSAADMDAARCEAVLLGAHHGAEKQLLRCAWSPDQRMVTCGSADR